jgi:hypothetical protein
MIGIGGDEWKDGSWPGSVWEAGKGGGHKGDEVQIYIDACPFWPHQRERPIRSRPPRGNAGLGRALAGDESLGRVCAKFGGHARANVHTRCGPRDTPSARHLEQDLRQKAVRACDRAGDGRDA